MADLFACPLPAYLADIPGQTCPVQWGQIQKVALQRKQTVSSFTTSSILLEATWSSLMGATDSTKVVISPYLNNVIIAGGDPIIEGGNDNTTLNGIPQLRGIGFSSFTAELRNKTSSSTTALKGLTAESAQDGGTNLWAYFFVNVNGTQSIITADDVNGIDFYNFVVGDVKTEGFNRPIINAISAGLASGYSDDWEKYTPTAFKPLNLAGNAGS